MDAAGDQSSPHQLRHDLAIWRIVCGVTKQRRATTAPDKSLCSR
jgi:hypothetical protein